MVDTTTSHFGWVKPGDHVNTDTWGAEWNGNLDGIDAKVWNNQNGLTTIQGYLNPQTLTLRRTATANGGLWLANGTKERWALYEDTGAESGGNTGSNLHLLAYNDAGSPLGDVFVANRATRGMTLQGPATFNSTAHFVGAMTAAAITSSGAIAAAGDVSGHIMNCATLNANQGGVTITGGSASASPTVALNDSTGTRRANFYWDSLVGYAGFNHALSGASLVLDPSANLRFSGSGHAYKNGAGSWEDISDARIKTVVGEYQLGLEDVVRLRPVIYKFKGNDTFRVGGPSPHGVAAATGTEFVGLVAQEVESIFPEMVTQGNGFIDGQRVDDLRTLDTSSLIFALVNAMKQLKAEVEALKAARP